MKRINLSIDLDENEIFDKEVTELIRAKVREASRMEPPKIIEEEVEAEVKRLVEASVFGYRDKIKGIVKSITTSAMTEVIKNMDMDAVIKEAVNESIDAKVEQYTRNIEGKCKDVLDKVVSERVKEKLSTLLS